jgi:HEAT repeat protein
MEGHYPQGVRLLARRRPKIEKLKQAGDVDALRAALDYRDVQVDTNGVMWDIGAPVRAEATTALAGIEGEAAGEGITQALSDPHPAVRKAALDAIAELPRPTGVERLLQGVVSWPFPADYTALEQAIAILVDWAPEGLAGDFTRRVLDPGAPDLDERHEDTLAALLAADPRGPEAATKLADELVGELRQPASTERAARAERLLGWLGTPGADSVVRALEGERASAALIRAAAALRDVRAVEPLMGLLSTGDTDARAAAATALGRLNDTRAVQALLAATQDPEQAVRDSASEALNGMGMAAVIVVVAGVMQDAVREQLAAVTGDTADPSRQVPAGTENSLPGASAVPPSTDAAPPAPAAHPPTWAQEVLGRLLKRAGG